MEDDGVELGEHDIWSMVDDMVNGQHSISSEWSSRASVGGGDRSHRHAGRLSVAFDDQPGKMVATSAPVNVPDWSKIYRVDSVESMHDSDDGNDDHDSDMVPPHEYLARSLRSTSKSVFEVVGQTLKGRDMSRVRDVVWSQTGFDG
ncbi:hypothetical protein L1987_70931 [Smallanthus sonchifolius]|uniref:Uncharacterized protein n=1 Tax=Smallanthus sonchifolius TaxID=185202 RepID=A0ACB9ARA0_9ASTR|nr:hypothetical protein L1987_70931 [Smallanthus sonchifolius]